MMQRLHCTYNDLRAMPHGVLEVFYAFSDGEAEAQKAKRDEQKRAGAGAR